MNGEQELQGNSVAQDSKAKGLPKMFSGSPLTIHGSPFAFGYAASLSNLLPSSISFLPLFLSAARSE